MYHNILVAYDGSKHADKAMDIALELAAKFDAELHLVQVVNHAHATSGAAEYARSENIDDPDQLEIEVAKADLLKRFTPKARDAGVENIHTEVTRGDPAECLLNYVQDRDVDMVVMGRRGVGRVEGLLVGSVSSKMSALAESAVLTVK
ncbi:MAG: universal stress protein [Rhodospirillaceae bacterium]|jgi:nucleotide-binding universal stress UspA family protein|nr:universal stress protein [Rhodospirillaceae bacterium]MBT3628207.1 universal stress protein [Rhodospirillaceae bacterium]MBT3926538.1 universal stress protein [Rhodospirillaceae bacterium]MBT4425738.1 universal stress protein [Rhodospirillaceae bacterium]MBT5037984.1 universal stress protein [Rhodospirillaceae bacterium]